MFSAPELLSYQHKIEQFDCGEEVLNQWLKKSALKNQQNNASRTFFVCDENQNVVAFYALASGAVSHISVTGNIRRNMPDPIPDPIPVIVLGRLAVDRRLQGQHLGVGLLKDVVLRAKAVSNQIGVKALIVHALN